MRSTTNRAKRGSALGVADRTNAIPGVLGLLRAVRCRGPTPPRCGRRRNRSGRRSPPGCRPSRAPKGDRRHRVPATVCAATRSATATPGRSRRTRPPQRPAAPRRRPAGCTARGPWRSSAAIGTECAVNTSRAPARELVGQRRRRGRDDAVGEHLHEQRVVEVLAQLDQLGRRVTRRGQRPRAMSSTYWLQLE